MQNQTITPNTRFRDLPSNIKARLINLNEKSNEHVKKSIKLDIPTINKHKFNDVCNLVTESEYESLKWNYNKLIGYIEFLTQKSGSKTPHKNLNGLNELKALVHKLNNEDRNIVGNLKECICLMTGRLDEIKRKRNDAL